MEIAEDKRKPPSWLTIEYITKALQSGMNEPSLQVKSMDIKPATSVGDNYASLVFRAVLMIIRIPTMTAERLSVVIKTLPPGDLVQSLIKTLFEREAKMYQNVLPEINKRLKDVFPDHKPLNARCFWYSNDPEPALILEDLKEIGFTLADRMSGLDETTTNMVLESIAKYHAGTLAIAKEQPEKLTGLNENLWRTNEQIALMAKLGLEGLIEEVTEWENFPKEVVQKLIDLRPVLIERMQDALELDESDLNVITHGDCWINNMMVYRENTNVKKIRLLDFQICGKNSAGLDLNYFIFTSPDSSMRLKMDQMLMTYYTVFMDTVKKLRIPLDRAFTFDDLRHDFKKRNFFGFIAAIIIYPITVMEKNDVLDVNDYFDENASKRKCYQNNVFQSMFRLMVPYFIESGLL